MGQTKGEKVNKKNDTPFYERKGPLMFCKVAGLLAGILLLVSPFLHWRVVHVKADTNVLEGFSLFDMVKYAFSGSSNETTKTKFVVAALFFTILLSALWIIYFAFRDQIYPERDWEDESLIGRLMGRFRLISHLIPPILAILGMIAIQKHAIYDILYSKMNETYTAWQGLMRDGFHDWKLPGLGCILFFTGLALYVIAGGLRYLIDTLNEDD